MSHVRTTRTLLLGFAGISGAASTLAAPQAQGVYLAQNGLVVAQFEASATVDDWTLSTSTPGFTDTGYFIWDGADHFLDPGAAGVFSFQFEADQAGEWQFRIRNRHEHPDSTEENDVWVRMDGGAWIKVFSNLPGSVGAWTWESRFDLHNGGQPDASYNLTAGVHTIEFSGRSHGFKMDRFHLYRAGVSNPLDTAYPESPRRFGDASCVASNNSTGAPSVVSALGSPIASRNDVTLECTDLPQSVLGYFIVSQTPVFVPNPGGGEGSLCVGGSIGRYAGNVLSSGTAGEVSLALDLTAIPRPTMTEPALPGETWYFQLWHRDLGMGGPTSNFSPALEIRFD